MLDDPTGIRIHTTGPFLKGRPYQDYYTASFIDAAKRVRNDVDVTSAQLMGEAVIGAHEGVNSKWSASIRSCFTGAADASYKDRVEVQEYLKSRGVNAGLPDRVNGAISDKFRDSMMGDFSNRYEMLLGQYAASQPGSAQEKYLDMYLGAVVTTVPWEELSLASREAEPDKRAPALASPAGMKP